MSIDRKGIVRGPDLNPVSRVHASDDPDRAIGRTGDAMARAGYQVLDRSEPRSFNAERRGLTTPVRERPDIPWDERDFPNIVY